MKNINRDNVLPWISIIVSIIGFFILYILNDNTNTTLEKINDKTINKEIELKKYEVNFKDKRDASINLSLSINKLNNENLLFCELTDHAWPKTYSKNELEKINNQKIIVIECLNDLDENTIRFYPYLDKVEKDSLKLVTKNLKNDIKMYFNIEGLFQGINKKNAFDLWQFESYFNYITYLTDKIYLETSYSIPHN